MVMMLPGDCYREPGFFASETFSPESYHREPVCSPVKQSLLSPRGLHYEQSKAVSLSTQRKLLRTSPFRLVKQSLFPRRLSLQASYFRFRSSLAFFTPVCLCEPRFFVWRSSLSFKAWEIFKHRRKNMRMLTHPRSDGVVAVSP